jgi:hypothetical protein
MFLGIAANAQEVPNSSAENMQLFDPNMPGRFGGGVPPSEGYFFSWEELFWNTGDPDTNPVGNPTVPTRTIYFSVINSSVQTNNYSTDAMPGNPWNQGQRIEFGNIVDHTGWLVSYTDLRRDNRIFEGRDMTVNFDEREFVTPLGNVLPLSGYVPGQIPILDNPVPLPVSFDQVRLENTTRTWSIEANYLYRTHPLGFNKTCVGELFFGARFMQIRDQFLVNATGGSVVEAVGALEALSINNEVENDIVGPQIGGRLFTRNDRWEFSTEGRFFAGFDFQNFHQRGFLQPNNSLALEPVQFFDAFHAAEFAPGAELRVHGKVYITRGFAFQAGWTGIFVDNIARAASTVDYTIRPTKYLGINGDNNRESIFINGLDVGIVWNR